MQILASNTKKSMFPNAFLYQMHMVHYKKGISKADIGNVENSVLVIGVLVEVSFVL